MEKKRDTKKKKGRKKDNKNEPHRNEIQGKRVCPFLSLFSTEGRHTGINVGKTKRACTIQNACMHVWYGPVYFSFFSPPPLTMFTYPSLRPSLPTMVASSFFSF